MASDQRSQLCINVSESHIFRIVNISHERPIEVVALSYAGKTGGRRCDVGHGYPNREVWFQEIMTIVRVSRIAHFIMYVWFYSQLSPVLAVSVSPAFGVRKGG